MKVAEVKAQLRKIEGRLRNEISRTTRRRITPADKRKLVQLINTELEALMACQILLARDFQPTETVETEL